VTDKPTTGKAASRASTDSAADQDAPSGEAAKAKPKGASGAKAKGRTGAKANEAEAATGADREAEAVGNDDAGADDAIADDAIEVDADLQAAADAVEVDLELLLAERAQYLDAYRRAQADFENYRKQAQKRHDDAVVRSLGRFVESLLPVLDSCDAALSHGATEVEPVLAALYGALNKEGLERVDPKGAPFDPTEAEAVLHEPGEGGEQVVAEVLRPGYRWRGQVLRPAMVKVTD
jgi:molecular chaperone GrpE